jgi:predicted NAD/FAD-dependent oxidoreductase
LSRRKFYEELKGKDLLIPLSTQIDGRKSAEPGTVDFVMPAGSSSVVKHYFRKSGVQVQFDQHVESVTLDDNRWKVVAKVCMPTFS